MRLGRKLFIKSSAVSAFGTCFQTHNVCEVRSCCYTRVIIHACIMIDLFVVGQYGSSLTFLSIILRFMMKM